MTSVAAVSAAAWRWAGGELLVSRWDDADEVALFHDLTASTHLVDAGVAAALDVLREHDRRAAAPTGGHPLGAGSRAAALDTAALWHAAFGGQADAGQLAALEAALERLAVAGLVQPARTPLDAP